MSDVKKLSKEYWKYWWASAMAMSASNILQYVLSLYVLDVTGSATLFASMLSIIFFPRMLLTPIAGVLADRGRKLKMMSGVLLGETAVLLIGGVLVYSVAFTTVGVFLLVVLLEIGEVFYNASEAAVIPELVSTDAVSEAVAASKVDDGIVAVLSPMAAALLYTKLQLSFALVLVGGLNLVACVLQKSIREKEMLYDISERTKNSFFKDFAEGIRAIREDDFLKNFIVILPVINLFFGATFSVSIQYLLRNIFRLNNYAYGTYNSVTAFVSVLIPVLMAHFVAKWKAKCIFSVTTKLIAVEIGMIGLVTTLGVMGKIPVYAAVIAITILDCMTIAEAIPMQMAVGIILQTGVEAKVLGRVSSTLGMAASVAVALGEFLFGIISDVFPVYISIFLGAAGIGVASVLYSVLFM
ncbi:MAG: MFS transporter, partial [Acetatifactor sp.]|nr:MFS transporter [Acetatifactor sp.]